MAWCILFHISDFWDWVGKRELCMLRETCRDFRADIPERLAILRVFRDRCVRKTELLRVLPLTVHDVLSIASPASFVSGFLIAENKTGGFDRCIAMMRERGWAAWCANEVRRAAFRDQVDARLRAHSIRASIRDTAAYRLALQRRDVCTVVVWKYVCRHEELRALGGWARIMQEQHEYQAIKQRISWAVGGYYRRISRDVRSAINAIRAGRDTRQPMLHVVLSGGRLLIGHVRFEPAR